MIEEQEDDMVAVGLRLGRVRTILGMTRKDFAERADVKPQVYGPIEKGERGLSLETAKKFRRTYGLPLEFMYFGKIDDLPHRIATAL